MRPTTFNTSSEYINSNQGVQWSRFNVSNDDSALWQDQINRVDEWRWLFQQQLVKEGFPVASAARAQLGRPRVARDPLILISLSRDGAEIRASVCKFFLCVSIANSRRKFVLLESRRRPLDVLLPFSLIEMRPARRFDGSHSSKTTTPRGYPNCYSRLRGINNDGSVMTTPRTVKNLACQCPRGRSKFTPTFLSHQHFCPTI